MKLTLPRWVAVLSAVLMLSHAWPAQAVRIKDIATFSGVRDNQLSATACGGSGGHGR